MNVGIYAGAASASPTALGGYSQTSITLPDARQAGLTDSKGKGAAVEVSISPQASTMLAIDMNSLAAKGYSQVDIDTDGKPGAEISIKVEPGAGTVAVGTDGRVQASEDQADDEALNTLLTILLSNTDQKTEQKEEDNGNSLTLQIAIRAYQQHLPTLEDVNTAQAADYAAATSQKT